MCDKTQDGDHPLTELEMLEAEYGALFGDAPARYTKTGSGHKKEFLTAVATQKRSLAALCLSGGGIRSATFNLGVIQGLAECRVLDRVDYISTVSGGGYVGGWLSAWIHRSHRNSAGVFDELRQSLPPDPQHARGAPEPEPLTHLREYSNFLTPRLGVFRADSAVVIATYIRNLLVNWIVFALVIAATLMIPRLYVALALSNTIGKLEQLWLFIPALLLMAMGTAMPLLALPSKRDPLSDPDVKVRDRPYGTRWVVRWVVLPVLLSSILLSLMRTWGTQPLFDRWWATMMCWMAVYVLPPVAVVLIQRRRKFELHALFALLLAAFCTGMAAQLRYVIPPLSRPDLYPHLFMIFNVPFSLMLYFLVVTFYVGFASGRPGGDDDREWWARLQGVTLLVAMWWIAAMCVTVGGPWAIAHVTDAISGWSAMLALIPTIAGAVALFGGFSGSTDARDPRLRTWRDRLIELAPAIGARVCLFVLAVLAAAGVNAAMVKLDRVLPPTTFLQLDFAQRSLAVPRPFQVPFLGIDWPAIETWCRDHPSRALLNSAARQALWTSAAVAGLALVLLYICGLMMNFNRFSLHAMYRDRLIRAYLGASSRPERAPDAFTGFDRQDNIPMHHLRRGKRFRPEELGDNENVLTLAELISAAAPGIFQILNAIARDEGREELRDAIDECKKAMAAQKVAARIAAARARNRRRDRRGFSPGEGALEGAAANGSITDRLRAVLLKILDAALLSPKVSAYGLPDGTDEHECNLVVEPVDIRHARAALASDGSRRILNRLILEEYCRMHDLAGDTVVHLLGRDGRVEQRVRPTLPKPFHVINLALNLVNTRNLAWQERKAASFSVTPLHCGFYRGYRHSADYGGAISLGTAMTISGAAASPNMGYHSSPAVTLLMTLFNVRLGWWLGNPAQHWGKNGNAVHRRPDPRQSVAPLISEALGRTNEEYDYVYLSDGGHFDNLGLYEMVRRGCRWIIISDASCDPDCNFDSLGNAIRKISSDLGVRINLRDARFFPKSDRKSTRRNRYCAVGEIDYKSAYGQGAKQGILIYIKPALHRLAPMDIYNHGRARGAFPHEPTSNQWFDESQFESYRRLGYEIVQHIWGNGKDPDDGWPAPGAGGRVPGVGRGGPDRQRRRQAV